MNPEDFNGNYGIVRDLYYKVKVIGFNVIDIVSIVFFGIASVLSCSTFFSETKIIEKALFVILVEITVIYALKTNNGSKKNITTIWLFLTRRRKRYVTFQKNRGEDL